MLAIFTEMSSQNLSNPTWMDSRGSYCGSAVLVQTTALANIVVSLDSVTSNFAFWWQLPHTDSVIFCMGASPLSLGVGLALTYVGPIIIIAFFMFFSETSW